MTLSKTLISALSLTILAFIGSACSEGQTVSPKSSPAVAEVNSTEVSPGYLFVSGWYKDSSVQKAYLEKIAPVIREHGYVSVKIGLEGMNLTVLEGSWTPRNLSLLRFDSVKSVGQFWHSPAYKNEVKPIRQGYSALDVIKLRPASGIKPMMDAESALLVFFVDLTDRKKLIQEYVPYAPKVVERYGGKFLVRSTRQDMELLEGDFPSQSIIIVEFPNQSSLKGFWNDKEYKALSEIRKQTGKWSVVEVLPFVPRGP